MLEKKIAGCIILKENKVLLIKKRSNNWFELPGGTIEPTESAQQTAIRELKEEICCDVEILSVFQEKEFKHKGKCYHGTWFLARIKEKQIPKIGEPEEYSEILFIPLEKLTTYPLSPNVEELLLNLETNQA